MKKICIICISLLIIFFVFGTIIIGESQAAGTADEVMGGAAGFIEEGEKDSIRVRDSETGNWKDTPYNSIDESGLKTISNFLYNLFLSVGIIVAVVVGIIIGIKFITGSVEQKAEYKEVLYPYLLSCAVLFGAFGIWKIVVNVLIKL